MKQTPWTYWPVMALPLAMSAWAGDDGIDRIRNEQVVRIGFREGGVPFSYLVPGAPAPVGYAIDICEKAVADLRSALGLKTLKVVYVPVGSKDRFSALQSRAIDMECANTTVNAERRSRGFGFSVPYFITGSRVMVKDLPGLAAMQGLVGKNVVLIEGTSTAHAVPATYPADRFGIRYTYVQKRAQAFELLEADKAHAMVEDDTVLYGLRSRSQSPERYTVVGSYLAVEPFAVMLRGDDQRLKRVLDGSIRELIRTGQLQALHRRWFQSPIPPEGRTLDIPIGFLMRDFMRYPSDEVNAFP